MQALVTHVLGARPDFMKGAPIIRALGELRVEQMLIHTGQHYDARMSDVFFADLGLAEPDVNLHVGSGAHGEQTAAVIARVERELTARRPALLLVYGDVNSTLGAALAAVKLHVPAAHVEAGLRSFDKPCRRRSTTGSPTSSASCCSSLLPRRSATRPTRDPRKRGAFRREHDDRHAGDVPEQAGCRSRQDRARPS